MSHRPPPDESLSALQEEWDLILGDSGFDDIEYKNGYLKQYDRRSIAFENRESLFKFFYQLDHFITQSQEIQGVDRDVLQAFSNGSFLTDISKRVGISVGRVNKIVKKYKKILLPVIFPTLSVDMTESWHIREAIGDDLAFIYSTWSRSYRDDSALGRSCRNSVFFPEYHKVIDRVLSQENTQVLVSCSKEDHKVIFGYLVFQPGILHYTFTKEAFWGMGIAKSLYNKAGKPLVTTHKTHHAKPILVLYPEITYNPFLLFKQQNSQEENHGQTNEGPS